MAHNDRAEAVKEVKDAKQEKGEGVERTLAEAHSEKALGTLVAQKGSDFISQKTNIDKVTVGDKTVDLTDGKHERERGAIKDAAKAMQKGDMAAVEKAFSGLSPEQAKTVAAGLDKALKPGARVSYDADNEPPTIDIKTKPDSKLMVPTDGKSAPERGRNETPYGEGYHAKGSDFKGAMDKVQKSDQERKAGAGLTMDTGRASAAPLESALVSKMEAAPVKMDAAPVFKDVPPPRQVEVRSGHDLSRADLKEEGIKRHTEKHGHETKSEVELPNGIKVENSKDTTPHPGHGRATVTEVSGHNLTLPQGMDVKMNKDGTVVDRKTGHPVVREMEDGSTRVWTDKGVYNVYPNGEVTKESAIKNRNGTWTIFDTKDPLGGLERK